MKKFAKLGFALRIACSLMVSTVAFADFVDGGEWHYGVGWTGTYGYSNYHHPTRSHTTTVKNRQHENRQRQGAGIWAKASIIKIPPTGMEYFYGF
ncbi:lactococcin 972 family bacteriocin [Streptococcus suis]